MQRDAGILRESVKEFLKQFGIEITDFVLGEGHIPNKEWSTGHINRGPRHGLIHR